MGAIPVSTFPGHKQLHERVVTALNLCQESRNVDFKEPASWSNLQVHIARTSMAMANLRDGGIIIVGVSERGGS
jgi:predicted HTH transcriptional regulator